MREGYEDIINMPYPHKSKYPIMSNAERAAQFAPFAALRGYDDIIYETYRLTSEHIELDEEIKSELDAKLHRLLNMEGGCPIVKLTYFVKDHIKDGGKYVTVTDSIKKLDFYEESLILKSGRIIKLEDLLEIEYDI